MAEHSPARRERVFKKSKGGSAIAAGFNVAAIVKMGKRLIEINQRRPYLVFFRNEHGSRLSKEHQRAEIFALLAESNGPLAQSFGCFIPHAQLFKPIVGILSKLR